MGHFGFEPRLTFGINRMTSRVATQQIFSPTEANREIEDSETKFTPIVDLSTYARIRLAENLNLSLGYQFHGHGRYFAVSTQHRLGLVVGAHRTTTDSSRLASARLLAQGINVGLQWQF